MAKPASTPSARPAVPRPVQQIQGPRAVRHCRSGPPLGAAAGRTQEEVLHRLHPARAGARFCGSASLQFLRRGRDCRSFSSARQGAALTSGLPLTPSVTIHSLKVLFEIRWENFQKGDAMLRPQRLLHSVAAIAFSVVLLSGGSAHDSDEFFVLVSANLQVPYWKTAGSGFSNAASQNKGVRFDFT